MQSIHKTIIRMPNWLFILLMVLIIYILPFLVMPIIMFIISFSGEFGGPVSLYEGSLLYTFMIGIVLGPIIETFIFQKSIIQISRRINFIKKHVWLQICISGIIFGIFHWYSLAYIFVTVLVGLVLAYSFIVFEYKKCNSFWNVVSIHALSNLIPFIYYCIDSGKI